MASGDIVQLFGTVTQGAADAFANAIINTGIVTSGKQGLAIRNIFLEQVTNVPAAMGADMSYEYALSRVVKAAMPTIFDNDVVWKRKWETSIQTSGAVLVDSVYQFAPNYDIILVESSLNFMIDTNGTAAVNTAVIRLDCEVVTVSDALRISILQNSLS